MYTLYRQKVKLEIKFILETSNLKSTLNKK